MSSDRQSVSGPLPVEGPGSFRGTSRTSVTVIQILPHRHDLQCVSIFIEWALGREGKGPSLDRFWVQTHTVFCVFSYRCCSTNSRRCRLVLSFNTFKCFNLRSVITCGQWLSMSVFGPRVFVRTDFFLGALSFAYHIKINVLQVFVF